MEEDCELFNSKERDDASKVLDLREIEKKLRRAKDRKRRRRKRRRKRRRRRRRRRRRSQEEEEEEAGGEEEEEEEERRRRRRKRRRVPRWNTRASRALRLRRASSPLVTAEEHPQTFAGQGET